MDAERKKYLWSVNRTKKIIIQDDTSNGDTIQWRSLLKFFLPKFRDHRFTLIVKPDDTIGAVKAYIQEEKGMAFKKQKLLNEDGEVLSDALTLVSLGINTNSTLILRYAPVIAQLSMRMLLMSFMIKDPWSLSRTMEIVIHDDTYKDVIEFRLVSKTMLPNFGPKDIVDGTVKDCRFSYTLMVGPDDTIAAVKAYIQEQMGYYFNVQKILNEGAALRDAQTLSSLGIKKGSSLILRYGQVLKISLTHSTSGCKFIIKIKPGDTVRDVNAAILKKAGIPLELTCRGRTLADHERVLDLDITALELS